MGATRQQRRRSESARGHQFCSLFRGTALQCRCTVVFERPGSLLWYRREEVVERKAENKRTVSGGAGSEVWNRVYMIAPVKKFGRVRLSTIFLQNKYGGECRHGRTMSFCSVLSFPASKHQEKVFKNIFNGIFGHQEAWCMNSSWVTTLIVIRHLGKFSYL